VAADGTRRIVRFFGARGDLLVGDAPTIIVYDGAGQVRMRTEVEGLLDVVAVGDELWAITPHTLTRLSAKDGSVLAREPLEYLDPAGRFLQSSTAPHLPVWHGVDPVLLRANPARTEVPGPGGTLILPIADGRWLLWNAGQLRLWRTIGEAWRVMIGEPGWRATDAQLVLDGRLFVFALQRVARSVDAQETEMRLIVAAVNDGAQTTQMRLPRVSQIAIAARRGIALARTGDCLTVLDLRFGRWIRDLALPPGVIDIAVDDGLQRIALATESGIELVHPDALVAPALDPEADVAPAASAAPVQVKGGPAPAANGERPALALAPEPPALEPIPLADEPLQLRLQLISARVGVAIAEAWDNGRISKPDPNRPPFADEVLGLMHLATGRATEELNAAAKRLRATEQMVMIADDGRAGRLTPLDVLARDFGLSQIAVAMLFAIVAPRLRGELARLYGILSNDPGRPLVDEHTLAQILGAAVAPEIARELDADRPLRKFGLVRVGTGDRPFVSFTVDPLVVRYIANQPPEGELDLHLKVRQVDRDLEELQLPRALVAHAVRFLASPRTEEPARIVVRGRTGSGRHTLLASLAARAGRSLGVIDLSVVPRESGRLVSTLEMVLRRAMLRGLVPCVDGLEVEASEDPDTTPVPSRSASRARPGSHSIRATCSSTFPAATSASGPSRGRSRSNITASSCPTAASSPRATVSVRASSSACVRRSCAGQAVPPTRRRGRASSTTPFASTSRIASAPRRTA